MKKTLATAALGTSLFFGAAIGNAQDQNLQPKYGSAPKSDALKASDAIFISGMDKEYHGDRSKSSEFMALRGWQYLSQGDLESAMRRFNQAWLLKYDNGTALWGMAAVEASRGQFDESLKLFAEADKLVGDNLNFSIDYAKALGKTGAARNDDALLTEAYGRFQRIYQKAPQNVLNLQNWAITLYSVGKYSDAWAKATLAETTPDRASIDSRFVAALESKMPRPKD